MKLRDNIPLDSSLTAEIERLYNLLQARSVDQIVGILSEGQIERRANAILLLGLLKAKDALPSLLALWLSKPSDLSWELAITLGEIGSKKSTRALMKRTRRSEPESSRLAAIYGLGLLGDHRAAPVLAHIVADGAASDELRSEAAESLAFCARRGRPAVLTLISALRDQSAEIRLFAAYALGIICDDRAEPALIECIDDSQEVGKFGTVGEQAAKSLANIRNGLR